MKIDIDKETEANIQWLMDNGRSFSDPNLVVKRAVEKYFYKKKLEFDKQDHFIREELWIGQKTLCFYCKRHVAKKRATLDHKVPPFRGGTQEIDNLVMACDLCNNLKGAMTAEEFLEEYKNYVQHQRTPIEAQKTS
jgi:5-methylcytosine-specific restriction endonuclease McrA